MTPNFSANPLASSLSTDQKGLSNSSSASTSTATPIGADLNDATKEVSFSSVLQGYGPEQSADNELPTALAANPLTGDAATAAHTGVVVETAAGDLIMSADLTDLSGLTTPPGGNVLPVDSTDAASLEGADPDNSGNANIILQNMQSGELQATTVDFTTGISPHSISAAVSHGAPAVLNGQVPGQTRASIAAANLADGHASSLLTPATAQQSAAQSQTQLLATHPSGNVAAQLQSEPLVPPVAMQNMLKQQVSSSSRFQATALPGISGLSGVESAAGDEAFIVQPGHASLASLSGDKPATLQGTPLLSTIPRLVGTPDWNQGLGQRMLLMVDNGLNQAELRLDPPQLGSIHVRIAINDDQAQLFFQAAHPAARDALESAMPRLREMFAEQGLQLGDADVSGQDQQSASDRSEQANDSQGTSSLGEGQEINGDLLDSRHRASSDMATRGLIDEFV